SHGGTRASAIVATEPVNKLFETRRNVFKRMIEDSADRLMKMFGYQDEPYRVIFPELVVQDRSAKMRDLSIAVQEGWVSRRRAAELSDKELGMLDFNWDREKAEIDKDMDAKLSPLSAPGLGAGNGGVPASEEPTFDRPTGIDGDERRD